MYMFISATSEVQTLQTATLCSARPATLSGRQMHMHRLVRECVCRPDQAYVAAKRLLTMVGVRIRQHQMAAPITISQGSFV